MTTAVNHIAIQGHLASDPKLIGRGSKRTGFSRHVRLRVRCPRPVPNEQMVVDVVIEEGRCNKELLKSILGLRAGDDVAVSGQLDMCIIEDNLYVTILASEVRKVEPDDELDYERVVFEGI